MSVEYAEWSNASGCWLKHPFNKDKRHFCEANVDIPKEDNNNCLLKHPFNKNKREACKLGLEYTPEEKENTPNCFLRHPFNKDKREACKSGIEYVEEDEEEKEEDDSNSNNNQPNVPSLNLGDIFGVGMYSNQRPYNGGFAPNYYPQQNGGVNNSESKDNTALYILGGVGAIVLTIVLVKKFL